MNEKLTIHNFGPITEAEVEFKRVTVFIGPTGAGKSTLAKLAVILRTDDLIHEGSDSSRKSKFDALILHYGLTGYFDSDSYLATSVLGKSEVIIREGTISVVPRKPAPTAKIENMGEFHELAPDILDSNDPFDEGIIKLLDNKKYDIAADIFRLIRDRKFPRSLYIPAERAFAVAIQDAASGLQNNEVALSPTLLDFMAQFEVARKMLTELVASFMNVTYRYDGGVNTVIIPSGRSLRLSEAASGVQAGIPLLLTTAYQYIERSMKRRVLRRFVVEEPELNLFPNNQRAMIENLVEYCASDDDELIVTTHSPYVLSHLNLLLYAHQVATQHPDRADEVAAQVPRESWINPAEFAAYYVGEGTVRSIVNSDLGLIDDNELDGIAGDQADAFDNLIRLNKGFAVK